MGAILVYIETRSGGVLPISFELLAAGHALARSTGRSVEALICAAEPDGFVAEMGAADTVLTVAHPSLTPYLPEAHAAVLASVVVERLPDVVLFGYTTAGLDLATAVAARTGRPLAAYCRKLEITAEGLLADAQAYGGKLTATVTARLPAVAAIMPGAYPEDAGRDGRGGEHVTVPPPPELDTLKTRLLEEILPDMSGVDLTVAEKILCVGRGIGEAAKIDAAREVCDLLGAELAGSRPVVDNGWLEKARQVGKSGRKVKPKLYVALGVSGAPEHLEGMAGADLIVAVNSDAKAPIFAAAHYGTTCDLFDLLPAVAERLRDGR